MADNDSIYQEFWRLEQDLRARTWAYLEPLGIRRQGFAYLQYIDTHPGCKVSELVDAMHMERSSVTRSLSALSKLGYVDRQMGKMETRAFLLELTPAGKAVVRAAEDVAREWEADLREAMGEDDYAVTLETLRRTRERFVRNRARSAAESIMRVAAF